MNWSVLYTPKSTGTVLSPDNYHQNNLSKYFSFYHMGNSNNNGKIGFLDHNEREIESIHMQRTQHGEWMTTNQVLIATNANMYIVHAMNRRSERIRENLKLQNDKLQSEKDAIDMSQQQTTSWNRLPARVLDQVIKNSTNPTFVTPSEDHEDANPTLATSNADQERAANNNDDNEHPELSLIHI